MTIEQIQALATLMGESKNTSSTNSESVWEIGKPYFVQTVTWAYTGRLKQVTDLELVLEDAALIPDTGRFADAMVSGKYSEVEPFKPGHVVIIGRYSVVSATHSVTLPKDQK